MSRVTTKNSTKKLTFMAIFAALIIVLQIVATFVKFGPVSITLALVPIIVGAAIYGKRAGAFLGLVFGLVVYIVGLMGWDGGFVLYLSGASFYTGFLTAALCIVKGVAAGFIAGAVYEAIKNKKAAVAAAGALCPITNTGIFAAGILLFFMKNLTESTAVGQTALYTLFVGWVGINFIVELFVNLILSAAICRIIEAGAKVNKK